MSGQGHLRHYHHYKGCVVVLAQHAVQLSVTQRWGGVIDTPVVPGSNLLPDTRHPFRDFCEFSQCCFHHFIYCTNHSLGRDSSVGITTRYGLDGPGIESL